jgi:uncharacterized short protein YbdD (DUF466 family)
MKQVLINAGRYLASTSRLMVGVSNYGAYVKLHQAKHPQEPVMSYEEFFKNRQQARFGAGGFKCC